ncbi:hypothetical protein [Candidatus Merdisoma sp. JLR.KK006]|uniref:hypothetical protein n=1 Tax=Candidatus Merdisoma sp. JLR.KK006 TaxID=3112626 RepID=UPI002FEF9A4D
MSEKILNIIAECLMDKELYDFISKDEIYLKGDKKIEELTIQLLEMDLSKEVHSAVNALINAYMMNCTRYSRLAYIKGFKDSAALLKEMNLIN